MSRQNSDTETSFSSDSEGRESDNNLSNLSEIRGYSSGNEADDEAENPITYQDAKNELSELVQQGTIHGIEEDSPQEELPPETQDNPEEEEKIDDQASQAVDNFIIEIEEISSNLETVIEETDINVEDVTEELPINLEPVIEEPLQQLRKSSRTPIPSKKLKESLEPLPAPVKPVRIRVKPKNDNKTTESSQVLTSQDANTKFEKDNKSEASAAKVLIEKRIRLETIKPDDQASAIYTSLELNAMTSCYLCGFNFKDRVSVKHNERWYPTQPTKVTKSYDHTAPVNFSFTVSRIPSQYYKLQDYEKEYLKANGKLACFHCNYTKSQLMFITCPKDDQGNIDFQKFQSNTDVIQTFLGDLLISQSEWCIGPNDVKNTLKKCIETYKGGEQQWIADRLASISTSADEVCTMIKKHVEQKSVIKRFYYIKLLIQKANELLKVDEYMNNQANLQRRKQRYAKKFIAHFVAKAEATDLRFVKPWKNMPFAIGTSPKGYTNKRNVTRKRKIQGNNNSPNSKRLKFQGSTSIDNQLPAPAPVNPYETRSKVSPYQKQKETVDRLSKPKGIPIVNPMERQRQLLARKKTGKGGLRRKRKTYRRIRLF
jgi:hypothetical protein